MTNEFFQIKRFVLLQILFLLLHFSPMNSVCQERFILTQENMPDFELAFQSKYEGRIYQQWKKNGENYSLYLYYYEYKDEYTSIKEISDRSGSFAALYVFGFPNGQIQGNSSWTSVSRTAAFIQLWNVGVQIFEPNGEIITNVADKLLSKIKDSISAEYLVKDNELKELQISLDNYDEVIGAAQDTLINNNFKDYLLEDSKWAFNTDSLVMGIRKQWSGESSFFSIDVCEFSSGDDAQKAAEQNANIKRSPFFLLDDETSLETAIEHWNYYWSVNDTIKYISVVGRTSNYAIHFYYFNDKQVNVDFFKSVISKFLNNTGISDVNIDNIAIYPNPSTGFITISVPSGNEGKCQLRLTDIQGRVVLLKEAEITGRYKLDLPPAKPGIYILEIKNETTAVSKRIVLQ